MPKKLGTKRFKTFINPYSRGAVLCKLAQNQIKGEHDDDDDDVVSENASSVPPSLPSNFPEDLLDDTFDQCISPNINSTENESVYCSLKIAKSFEGLSSTTSKSEKEKILPQSSYRNEGEKKSLNFGFENDLDNKTALALTELAISPQNLNDQDTKDFDSEDFDYAPSLTSDGSVSPQKSQNFPKSNSYNKTENIANSQNSADCDEKVTVQSLKNCSFKSRKNYCPYCLKLQAKLPRHMINKHKVEKKVQEFMLHPKNSKERAIILEELRKIGNFRHNSFVINNSKGEILTTVRPKNETEAQTYVPCRNCLGFYPKSILWRHNSQCRTTHKPNLQNKRIVGHGVNLLMNAKNCSKQFIDNVVGPMNTDEINLVVRNDLLILKFGESMFTKHPETWKFRYARNSMRELARLLISLRKIDKSISSLRDTIHPTKFQNIVLAAKEVAGFDGKSSFDHGSLVLKIGISIKKCAEILSGMSLDEGNEELSDTCEKFIKRFDREWANNISSLALRDLSKKKFNKPKYLPVVEDFQKLNKYINNETKIVFNKLENFQKNLESFKDRKTEIQTLWMNLMQLTLSSIILFNRRRSGEAERIIISYYERGLKATSSCPDLQKTLSTSDQMFAKYFKRIEIPGKRGNKVPVILSHTHISCIDLILKLRNFIGVNLENRFLFPRPNCDSLNPISGPKALRDIVNRADLKQPETMLSTNLRKHIATMSQVLNLSQPELEELCKMMGHDIRVHASYYRLPDDAVQLCKLTKLLIAVQNGDILKYRNKTIDEIELDPEEFITEGNKDEENMDLSDDEVEDGTDFRGSEDKPKKKQTFAGKFVRRSWSQKERDLTVSHFKLHIQKQKLPGKAECSQFLNLHTDVFEERNWLHIKNFIRNKIITLNNRVLKN